MAWLRARQRGQADRAASGAGGVALETVLALVVVLMLIFGAAQLAFYGLRLTIVEIAVSDGAYAAAAGCRDASSCAGAPGPQARAQLAVGETLAIAGLDASDFVITVSLASGNAAEGRDVVSLTGSYRVGLPIGSVVVPISVSSSARYERALR